MSNAEIVARLRAEAARAAQSGGNLYRVRALRQAAFIVTGLTVDVAMLSPAELHEAGIGWTLAERIHDWAAESSMGGLTESAAMGASL
jgi:hypothetical protein